nr:RNA-guided endonuclease TnpB family protein [Acetilactobacillus jinshanensis]
MVLKTRLYPSQQQGLLFSQVCEQYRKACNYASRVYFKHNCNLSVTAFHCLTYRTIRAKYGLKSQLAVSVPRTIKARYQSVDTQLRHKSYSFQNQNTKQWYHGYKNIGWLWNPIKFNRPQADLVANRDWSLTDNCNHLSVNTLKKRAVLDYYLPKYFKKYLGMTHKLGTAKLLNRQGHWYLHIACTVDTPDFDYHKQTENTVGIDRGLRFLAYTYDNHRHSLSFNGLKIRRKRCHFLKHRAVLQAKGTKSAKRKLKSISGRENRWMTNVNHRVSKALVRHYGKRTTFVLEDLRGVRFSTEQVSKKYRYSQVTWTFYQLEQFLKYKAKLNQSIVIKINPKYTSQRCPHCGRVLAQNRQHHIHKYICEYCEYSSNDDRIGAMNIRWLGQQKVQSIKKHFKPTINPNLIIKDNGQLALF